MPNGKLPKHTSTARLMPEMRSPLPAVNRKEELAKVDRQRIVAIDATPRQWHTSDHARDTTRA
jgi:hypothetical protein